MRAADFFAAHRNALAAENYRTHAQRGLAQIWNLHVGLEGAHAAGLIFAHHKFQVVAARSEDKTGVVLHIFAADLLRAVESELDGVAQMPDRNFTCETDFADHVYRSVIFI